MPTPYIAKWIQLVVHYSHENSDMVNTFNYEYTGAPVIPDLNALCVSWFAVNGPPLIATLNVGYTVRLVEATYYDHPFGAYGSYTPTASNVGTVVGDALPANCSLAVKLTTGVVGRSRRGRIFITGLSDASATGSVLTATAASQIQSLVNGIFLYHGPAACPVNWVVASRKDLALYTITGSSFNTVMDSQRRRLPTRGT